MSLGPHIYGKIKSLTLKVLVKTSNLDEDGKVRISLKPYNVNDTSTTIRNMYKIFTHHVMMHFKYILIPICDSGEISIHNMSPQDILSTLPEVINTENNEILGNLTKMLSTDWHDRLKEISIDFRKYIVVSDLGGKFHMSHYLNDLDTDEESSEEFLNSPKIIFTVCVRLNDHEFKDERDKYLITYCEKEVYEYLLKESSIFKFPSLRSGQRYLLRPYFMPTYYKEMSEVYDVKLTKNIYSIRRDSTDSTDSDNEEDY